MGLFDFFKRKKDSQKVDSKPKTNTQRVRDEALENPEFLGRTADFIKKLIKEGKDSQLIKEEVRKKFFLTSTQTKKVIEIRLESYLNWGSFELNRNSLDGAKGLLNAALVLDPNSKIALINLGVLHSRLEEYEKSLAYYEKAVQLYPNEFIIHDNLALTYEELNDAENANKCYQTLLKLKKDDTELLFRYSQNLIELGFYEKALVYLERIIKLGGEDIMLAKYSKIGVLYKLGDKATSLRLYRQISKENPDDFHIHQIIPNWLVHDGKQNEVMTFFESEYEYSKNSKLLRLKADFLYNDNKYQAISAYNEYLEIVPNDVDALNYRLRLKIETGESINIEKEVDYILSINPEDVTSLKTKFINLANQNELEKAAQFGEKIYELNQSDLEHVNLLIQLYGKLYNNDSRFDEAIESMKAKTQDEAYNIQYRKGLYLKGEKIYDKAIQIFNDLNLEYNFAWNYYQIAIIENLRGNIARCFEYLETTFELDESLKADAKQYHELQNLWQNERFIELTK